MEEGAWLHCNSCYNVAARETWPAWLEVVFTNCGHVFCQSCFPASYDSVTHGDSICPLCGKPCQAAIFTKDCPPARIQPWFEDWLFALERATKVARFQWNQQVSLVRGLGSQLHRLRQQEPLSWQQSSTSNSYQVHTDAWDLSSPQQARHNPHDLFAEFPAPQRQPFFLSPSAALNQFAGPSTDFSHSASLSNLGCRVEVSQHAPTVNGFYRQSTESHPKMHSPHLIGDRDGLLLAKSALVSKENVPASPTAETVPSGTGKEVLAQFRYRPLGGGQEQTPSGMSKPALSAAGSLATARLLNPPTSEILGCEPSKSSGGRIQQRMAQFRKQQQGQAAQSVLAPSRRRAPPRRGLDLSNKPVQKKMRLSNTQSKSLGESSQAKMSAETEDDHYETFQIAGKQQNVTASVAPPAEAQKEE